MEEWKERRKKGKVKEKADHKVRTVIDWNRDRSIFLGIRMIGCFRNTLLPNNIQH